MFQQWIAEGRVAADSWVWRTGWADWKAGSEALALERPAAAPVAAAPVAAAPFDEEIAANLTLGPTDAEVGSAEVRRREIKRRNQRTQTISAALALVALGLLMVLVFVLAR
jgi:hypothetical protein